MGRIYPAPTPLAPRISVIQAMEDESLFRPWFQDDVSWYPWKVFLRVLFGLPLSAVDLAFYVKCTGRSAPPSERIEEVWTIVGRRGGKSLILALIGVYLSVFGEGWWKPYIVPGEFCLIPILAADRKQSRAIYRYARALLERVPLLVGLLDSASDEELCLSNGISLEISTASWRGIRGGSIPAALCDEIAIWQTGEVANPDHEILAAIRPAMASFPRPLLLCAGSPYAKRGEMYDAYKRYFGKESAILVWRADTRTMRPTLSARVIDRAFERDDVAAASEYGRDGTIDFRSDLEGFAPREVIEAAVISGRYELPRLAGVSYFGFSDAAGGSGGDSFASAVAHLDLTTNQVVLDGVRETRPPFSPESAVAEHAKFFLSFGVRSIRADRWGGQFPVEAFRKHGIECEPSEKTKSDIYRDALPLLNSARVELLDNVRLVNQLASLERRTARGGKDSIDHPPAGHDDICNAACGALVLASAEDDDMSHMRKLGMPEATEAEHASTPIPLAIPAQSGGIPSPVVFLKGPTEQLPLGPSSLPPCFRGYR